jgi:antitoxin component YwqK of YwqJK toxin-antitoxin module
LIQNDGSYYIGGWINGKKGGHGKEYNFEGLLRFKGKFINGKREGDGIEYYYNGKVKY